MIRLPIDAVPDITNKQVQVNTTAFALSPVEIEKQVTFRIETALAGIPGLEGTRSISRNGFSQVTAVFTEKTDIYFARQQVSERLLELRSNLPPGVDPKMGPISTGLGEIYMWSIGFAPHRARCRSLTSRRKANTSTRTWSAPPICAPCRIGSSGRRSGASWAWPASIPSAATSNNTRSSLTP